MVASVKAELETRYKLQESQPIALAPFDDSEEDESEIERLLSDIVCELR